jgi:hypothetical protein
MRAAPRCISINNELLADGLTVSLCKPRSALLPVVNFTRSKALGQRFSWRRAASWISPQ